MNKKSRNKLIISVVSVIALVLVGVLYFSIPISDNKEVAESPPKNGITSYALFKDHFFTTADMIKASDIVIIGTVVDSYPVQIHDLIFTNQVIEITKTYKGDLIGGDKIEVRQTGGELNGIITAPFAEDPLLAKNADYLFALENSNEGYYVIMGGFQGIAEVRSDTVLFTSCNQDISKDFTDDKANSFTAESNSEELTSVNLKDVEALFAEEGLTIQDSVS